MATAQLWQSVLKSTRCVQACRGAQARPCGPHGAADRLVLTQRHSHWLAAANARPDRRAQLQVGPAEGRLCRLACSSRLALEAAAAERLRLAQGGRISRRVCCCRCRHSVGHCRRGALSAAAGPARGRQRCAAYVTACRSTCARGVAGQTCACAAAVSSPLDTGALVLTGTAAGLLTCTRARRVPSS